MLAVRVLREHAAVQARHQVGDLGRHLLDVDDARRLPRRPGRGEERERLAVLGQIVDRDRQPRRLAIARQVVEVKIALVGHHHVLRWRIALEARAQQVFPREVEHHVVRHHRQHRAALAPPQRHLAIDHRPSLGHPQRVRDDRALGSTGRPAEALQQVRREARRAIAATVATRRRQRELPQRRLERPRDERLRLRHAPAPPLRILRLLALLAGSARVDLAAQPRQRPERLQQLRRDTRLRPRVRRRARVAAVHLVADIAVICRAARIAHTTRRQDALHQPPLLFARVVEPTRPTDLLERVARQALRHDHPQLRALAPRDYVAQLVQRHPRRHLELQTPPNLQ